MTPAAFRTYARYNAWQNASLVKAANTLSDEARKRDRGAFFKSIHLTFNHLILGDRAWMGRFEGPVERFQSLDQELYSDWTDFTTARAALDDRILRYTENLDDAALSRTLTYRMISAPQNEVSFPLTFALMHFFNHQTHHRGQITALLMQAGVDPGVTDLLRLPDGPTS